MPTFFLPPLDTAFIHSPDRFEHMTIGGGIEIETRAGRSRWRGFTRSHHGLDENGEGGITIDGVNYLGGRWNGPLTAAQIASLTAAGYASRLVVAAEPGLLPPGID